MSVLIGDSLDTSVNKLFVMFSSQKISAPNIRPQVSKVIAVPTSEHVAQIVGKSGSKIKNLRTATQTSIKTPLRGDAPIFTVRGTEDSVDRAFMVIQRASYYYTRLMYSRFDACADRGDVTIKVFIPRQYLGFDIGRNGSVILPIKERTETQINTRELNSEFSIFEVTGTQVCH